MATTWPDEVDRVIAGDMTAALAYVTPAGGAVVTAVAPIGMRDRERGSVGFTTSLGFGKKLERIRRNPRVALAYHARKHGFADGTRYVMVQGDAELTLEPDRDLLETEIQPRAEPFLGPRKSGRFWDRWLQEYYSDRVPVAVQAARVIDWPDDRAAGDPAVFGLPLPREPPPPQAPPAKGTGPRLDAEPAGKRLRALPNQLLAFVGADGYPEVVPVEVTSASAESIELRAARPLPRGGRRAGLLAHSYRAHLVGLATRGHTGWMSVGEDPLVAMYAPHSAFGFRAPSNKTLLLLANGLLAKRGLRRARRSAASA